MLRGATFTKEISDHEDTDDAPSTAPVPQDKPEKKRRRPALSCEQCRQRKIRCDRNVPCNHCVKSKISTCSYAPTHVPASRAKKHSLAARKGSQPALIQPASGTGLPSPSTESTGARPDCDRARADESSPSLPGSTRGSAQDADNVDWLVNRVHQLEKRLAESVRISESHDAGPGEGMLESKEDDDETRHPVKGMVCKTRYFGQSHWMNGADLFPIQLSLLTHSEMEKTELFTILTKCKKLARNIKERRLQPLSSINLGRQVPARELADPLVEAYLRTFEGVVRILHVPTFRAEYERYWQNPDAASDHFVIQLQLCLSMGAVLYDDTFSLRALSTQCIYEAHLWLMLPPEKSRMTIAGIQVMCLLIVAKSVCAVGHDLAWVTTGALVRKAMYMGLHRDPRRLAKMSRYRAEMRRRLWATILELNLQSAFEAGGSPLLSRSDYDTRPPANLDDDELGDEPDDDPSNEQSPEDVATQTSIQIALLRSLSMRTNLLKHVNDVQTAASYTETLRINSDLTKACLSTTQSLTALAKNKKGKKKRGSIVPGPVTAFHINVAEIFLYRCFHSLHQPVLTKSLEDPKYYFSRKMVLDSALKLAHMCGLSGAGGSGTCTLPRGSDFRRLIVNGTGMFRTVPVQSTFGATIALLHHRKDRSISLGYLPSLGDADLRACVEAALGWMLERLASGETNIKGTCFIAACLAQIDAVDAGRDVEASIMQATVEAAARCWEGMKERARSEGVPVEEAGAPMDTDGFSAFDESWMGQLAWDDMNMAGFAWPPQGPFHDMSPLFAGEL